MVFTDIHLQNLAKAMNSESFTVPVYQAVGENTITADPTDTALDGEIGTRVAGSKSRTTNQVSLTALRSGADVIDTINGDDLRAVALFDTATSGELHTELSISSLIQTTSFDLEFQWDLGYNRR